MNKFSLRVILGDWPEPLAILPLENLGHDIEGSLGGHHGSTVYGWKKGVCETDASDWDEGTPETQISSEKGF